MLPGPHRRGALLLCGRYLLAPLIGSKGLMVLRLEPTPTRFLTNSLYTPMNNTPLNSTPSVCRSWTGVQWPNRHHERGIECKRFRPPGYNSCRPSSSKLTLEHHKPYIPYVFPTFLHGYEPPVVRSVQCPWIRPGWPILPTRDDYCSNTN